MASTKSFPAADVLSTITGSLVSSIDGVYKVLNWMTGESIYTHQLPRIGREAAILMVALRPELRLACDEAAQVNPDNWREWLARWEARYGPAIDVPKFDANSHERIDPISELAERVHPDKIIVVKHG